MTTFAQLLEKSRKRHAPRTPSPLGRAGVRREPEHDLQCACVQWFRLQYPKLAMRLFAVPNGGGRSKAQAGKLKAEGVLTGVSDLILLKPNISYCALLIEMKVNTKGSRQSEAQKEWQHDLTALGEYKYVVCRSIDDFIREVNSYLNN